MLVNIQILLHSFFLHHFYVHKLFGARIEHFLLKGILRYRMPNRRFRRFQAHLADDQQLQFVH